MIGGGRSKKQPEPVEETTAVQELRREIRNRDQAAALCFREGRACFLSAEQHLIQVIQLQEQLQVQLDRRRRMTRGEDIRTARNRKGASSARTRED